MFISILSTLCARLTVVRNWSFLRRISILLQKYWKKRMEKTSMIRTILTEKNKKVRFWILRFKIINPLSIKIEAGPQRPQPFIARS